MFDDIFFSDSKVKIITSSSYSFMSLKYLIEDHDDKKLKLELSEYLPFCDSGTVKIKDQNSPAIEWSKQILTTLGYQEESNNQFVLKNDPEEVDFSHSIIYVPLSYKEEGKFKSILFSNFGKQLTFWPFVSLKYPFNLNGSSKGGGISIGDSAKLRYSIIEVIESFIAALTDNIILIEKDLELQTSTYGRTKYDTYYVQNTHLIKLKKFEGTVMPPKIILRFTNGVNFIDLSYRYNVPLEFIDELNENVKNNSCLRFSQFFTSRIEFEKNVQPSKLIDSIKKLAFKHKIDFSQN
jgi:hypothetical protein